MLVRKQTDPDKWEWINEHYEVEKYSSYFREEEGCYEIYCGSRLISKAHSKAEIDEIIASHRGTV